MSKDCFSWWTGGILASLYIYILCLYLDPQDKYYEEDFNSSASDKTKPERNHSPSGSASEVEEEILSTGEDQLNSSLSIGVSY